MSLREKTIIAVKWNLLSTIVSVVLGIVSLWALSHILTVQQYGVISASLIMANFFLMLLDFGISNSIIRQKTITDIELSSLSILNIIMGCVAFIICFSMSSYISALFNGTQDLVLQIRILATSFIFVSIGLQSKALLTKEMRFSVLSRIVIITSVVNFGLSISLALIFHESWCVAVSFLVSTLMSSLLTRYHAKNMIRFNLRFSFNSLSKHFKYGMQLVSDSIVNQVSINTYPVLMSRLISLSAIGGYNIAYSISIALFEKLNPVLSHALFPAFSKIGNDENKLNNSFLKATCFSSMINFPMLLGMMLVSQDVVSVFFDEKWAFISPIVQILCVVGAIRSLDTPVISILLVKAQMYRNVNLGIFKLLIGIPLTWWLGIKFGIKGIVCSFLIIQVLNTICGYFYLIRPCTNIPLTHYLRSIAIPFCHVLPMVFCGVGLELILKAYHTSEIFNLLSKVAVCIFIYILTILFSPSLLIKELREIVLTNFLKRFS
ncbi:MOP flippase family protein [Pluralibacter gergoviae]|uniref:MOP flippase family protein n=1 Tax=Pluralibacter gergoviae TaxID=61647 RepID=UPI000BFBD458|nr:MOP flippase family protein [Pluralibacter gergoviae]PHH46716.1 colanic acid exporter [Pluralibacter gergoviae]